MHSCEILPNDGNKPISDLAVEVHSVALLWLALAEHLDVLQDVVHHVDALEVFCCHLLHTCLLGYP